MKKFKGDYDRAEFLRSKKGKSLSNKEYVRIAEEIQDHGTDTLDIDREWVRRNKDGGFYGHPKAGTSDSFYRDCQNVTGS